MARTTKSIDAVALTVTINYTTGSVVYKASDLPQAIKDQALCHGLSQLLGDSYAGEKDEANYRTHADKRWNSLKAGDWASRQPAIDKVAEALAAIKAYDELSDDEKLGCAKIGITRLALVKAHQKAVKAASKK